MFKPIKLKKRINLTDDDTVKGIKDIKDKIIEELKTIKKKKIKVCNICNEIGHNSNSPHCKDKIYKNNILKNKILNYFKNKDMSNELILEEDLRFLSEKLNITHNACKELYKDIDPKELIDRNIDLERYIEQLRTNKEICNECEQDIIHPTKNNILKWKGNILCDSCWSKYSEERENMWRLIKLYKPCICEICNRKQTNNLCRFHYDHLNMFDKEESICCMVKQGIDINYIYKQIDKCQILCFSCHDIISDIEKKYPFTRIKQILTRKYNNQEITEEEYNEEILNNQALYDKIMLNIYKNLRVNILKDI